MISAGAETGLAVAALLVLVLLARRAVTKRFGARAAYALWLLPILRLLTPPISLPAEWGISRWITSLTEKTPDPAPLYVAYYDGPAILPPAPSGLNFADIWPTALLSLWALGIVIGGAIIIFRQCRHTRHMRRMSMVPAAPLDAEISRAVRLSGLRSAPSIRVSRDNDGPMVCGLLRPIIILPAGFSTQFTPEQRHLALLHELTHIRRGDLFAAAVMLGFRLINWPNPLVHLAWPRFRADQEAACDAAVLRLTGEDARANYAETLLTAARTATQNSGRATPALGTGLTLSLHHPVKERLMTLGTSTQMKRGAGRWGLAALLLAGAAMTAPLSLADGPNTPDAPKVTTKSKSVQVIRAEFDGEKDGYEIRAEDGVKTYIRVSRDGTTENLTREELEAEYDIDVDALLEKSPPSPPRFIARVDGEPGLSALSEVPEGARVRTMIIDKKDSQSGASFEVKVENGVRQVFKIEEDGTRTEISEDEMGKTMKVETIIVNGSDRFPMVDGEKEIRIFTTNNNTSHWVTDDEEGNELVFGLGGEAGPAMAQAQLRSAQSMLESTDRMIADLSTDASKDAQKDLRDAARELEKARKALTKARLAVEKSGDR